MWTFNDMVPGPMIRGRVGDVVELTLKNTDQSGNPHNIDCHAFEGPGGGAPITTAQMNESKTARFKLLYPGLYVYHCAAVRNETKNKPNCYANWLSVFLCLAKLVRC